MKIEHFVSASALTIILAPAVGAYLCLSAFGLLHARETSNFLTDVRERPAAMHCVGAIALFLGAGLLTVHRHWSTPAEVVLGLVAAWWAFEGAGMLADPSRLRAAFAAPQAVAWMRASQWVSIPVGLYLIAVGVFGVAR